MADAVFMHHAEGGGIFADWSHDGDPLYHGRCTECGWDDSMDHCDIHVAETALAEHEHLSNTP